MALSTSMPVARAMPPRDMMFKLTAPVFMSWNVASKESGMAKAIKMVCEGARAQHLRIRRG